MSKNKVKAAIGAPIEVEAQTEQPIKKVAAKQPEKAPAKKQVNLSRVYLGPTIPGTGLERYKVFKGELHSSVTQLAVQVPAVKRLIVDTKEMANIERKIGDKTTVYAHAFAEIVNHIKEVMKR